MSDQPDHPLSSWISGIAPRMLALIVLFSSAITLLSTGLQLYLDYNRDVSAIHTRLNEIEHSSLNSLAGSLWNVDLQQMRLQLEGMMRLPDMQALEIRETMAGVDKPLTLAVGRRQPQAAISRTYALVYNDRGSDIQVGTLYAEASLDGIYGRLWNRAVFILVSQGIKTFLVSLFTLYIVYRLITRHLIHISHTLRRSTDTATLPSLRLHRTPPRRADELDLLVHSFNDMADNLHSTVERLTLSNRELERFAYIASHDLQEPLRSVVSFTQLLERHLNGTLDAEGREYLRYITGGALRMRSLIHDLLEFSQINQSVHPLRPLSPRPLWDAAIKKLQAEIDQAQASIQVDPMPQVVGESAQLVTLFHNLLANAVKFRRPGQAPNIQVRAEMQPDGHCRFAVQDDGIGIAATDHDIFDVFRRMHPADQYPGTGIGLAICKRIVLRHGGQIWVDSVQGQGSCFYFTLPVPEQPAG